MNKPNNLIKEKSPYLLQHAYNPVNWYAWTDEAFEKARYEDKPIFLSIGYSTCHWCHVMEKESFEDEEVAKLMNDNFISIKVDREERPDIDGIYMSVCQMITGGGGWPLTIIMTPDKKPFFAGTYFPKYNRFNRIGMLELVPRIGEVWKTKRKDIEKSADEITVSVKHSSRTQDFEKLDESVFRKSFSDFEKRFDKDFGGFGTAPKFPSPHNLIFLLRFWKRFDEPKALEMVEQTLKQMRWGGIYDHIGFGFARYSTDKKWIVPHFEKMLYDQALLSLTYTETFLVTKNHFYKNVAVEILEYILRDMTHPEGGFFSAEDADSEGEEGKFYLWYAEELRNILDKDELDIALKMFNVEEDGNWIDESKGIKPGTNILFTGKSLNKVAEDLDYEEKDLVNKLKHIRLKLFNYRNKRIHPHKDDKILTDWNGLMISAFAKAAQAFDIEEYKNAAEKSFHFIVKYLTDKDNKLFHRFREGDSGIFANVDDYVFMINAAIDLYETTFDFYYLEQAVKWNDILINDFWDKNAGGFFFTSEKNEDLIARQKEIYDGAIPSGNSVELLNLLRLFRFTEKIDYAEKTEKLIEYFSGTIARTPFIFSQFLIGLDFYFGPAKEIVISFQTKDDIVTDAVKFLHSLFKPNKIVILNKSGNPERTSIVPFINQMKPIESKTTFYICENFVCSKPLTDLSEFKKKITA